MTITRKPRKPRLLGDPTRKPTLRTPRWYADQLLANADAFVGGEIPHSAFAERQRALWVAIEKSWDTHRDVMHCLRVSLNVVEKAMQGQNPSDD
jgi:hypothetical protein